MELLEVQHLHKKYKNFELEDISFGLPSGYIMGYVGRNGAGKTTTINLITHVCRSMGGRVCIDGISYEEDPVRYLESIGYVSEELGWQKDFKIRDVRKILCSFYDGFDREKFDGLVEQWNLPENKKLSEFSRGMKMKLQFATVFARKTKLLILDEATNGLDPVMRHEVLTMLQDYIADGAHSVLFSTHILSDLEQIADYIYFIDEGRTLLYDTKDALQEGYLLVKGDVHGLGEELRQALIGITENAYGFEAILPSDRAGLLSGGFVYEKPAIDQIVIHFIEQRKLSRER